MKTAFMLFFVVLLSAASGQEVLLSEDFSGGDRNNSRDTYLSGTLTLADSPLVIYNNCWVSNNLIIEPGVQIRFEWGGRLYVQGTLQATGTSTQPISFTQIAPETQPSTIITIFGQAAFTHCVFQDAITSSGGMCTIDSTDEVSFVHCHFLNNSAYAGGAVYIGNSDVTFTSSEFINNTASGCAGAIYIGSSGTCNLDDCLISGNTSASQAGAIGVDISCTLDCYDTHFSNNSASSQGGAIYSCNPSGLVVNSSEFTDNTASTDGGAIYITSNLASQPILSINSTLFSNNTANGFGGGIYMNHVTMNINDSDFDGNVSVTDRGGGIYATTSAHLAVDGCSFTGNESTLSGAAIYLVNSSSIDMNETLVADCGNVQHGTSVVHLSGSTGAFSRCTFCDNYESTYGILAVYSNSSADISSCIFWNNIGYDLKINDSTASATVRYCDYQGGQGAVYNSGTLTWGTGNINSDPLFTDAANETYTLQANSPCINTGDPALGLDDDGTYCEMGAYYLPLMPIFQSVVDVPYDQGRQIFVHWNRSPLDYTYTPGTFYSVWRQDTLPDRAALVIDSPADLPAEPQTPVVMLRDTEVWTYITQAPAIMAAHYTVVAPTLADSSSTGLHAAMFMVYYHGSLNLYASLPDSGYSVDNIPPDEVRGLDLAVSGGTAQLTWNAVTTGTFEGNSYPEQNGVWYRVYAGDSPDFPCDAAHLLAQTQTLSTAYSAQTVQSKFFRVVSSDQP